MADAVTQTTERYDRRSQGQRVHRDGPRHTSGGHPETSGMTWERDTHDGDLEEDRRPRHRCRREYRPGPHPRGYVGGTSTDQTFAIVDAGPLDAGPLDAGGAIVNNSVRISHFGRTYRAHEPSSGDFIDADSLAVDSLTVDRGGVPPD